MIFCHWQSIHWLTISSISLHGGKTFLDKQFYCITYRVILKYQLVLDFLHKAYIIELKVWEDGGGSKGQSILVNCHITIPWRLSIVLLPMFQYSGSPLPPTSWESLKQSLLFYGFFKTCLSGVMKYFFIYCLPYMGLLSTSCPPSSLVSTFLSPSLCGWLLISSKGKLDVSHSDAFSDHPVWFSPLLPSGPSKLSNKIITALQSEAHLALRAGLYYSPIRHYTNLDKVTLRPWKNETEYNFA